MYPSRVSTACSASPRDGRGWSARTAAARNSDGSSSAGRVSGALTSEDLASDGLLARIDLIKASMSSSSPFDRSLQTGVSPGRRGGLAAGRLSPLFLAPPAQNWLPNRPLAAAW